MELPPQVVSRTWTFSTEDLASIRHQILADARGWYFGPWGEPGHYLFDEGGRRIGDECYVSRIRDLDGGLAPVNPDSAPSFMKDGRIPWWNAEEYAQGVFATHHEFVDRQNLTIIAWWDRTQGDARSRSNACFIADGHRTPDEMVGMFRRLFPSRFGNLVASDIRLRPVSWVRNYDPSEVAVTWNGIEFRGFSEGTLINNFTEIDNLRKLSFRGLCSVKIKQVGTVPLVLVDEGEELS